MRQEHYYRAHYLINITNPRQCQHQHKLQTRQSQHQHMAVELYCKCTILVSGVNPTLEWWPFRFQHTYVIMMVHSTGKTLTH